MERWLLIYVHRDFESFGFVKSNLVPIMRKSTTLAPALFNRYCAKTTLKRLWDLDVDLTAVTSSPLNLNLNPIVPCTMEPLFVEVTPVQARNLIWFDLARLHLLEDSNIFARVLVQGLAALKVETISEPQVYARVS